MASNLHLFCFTFAHLSKQPWTESFILNSTHSKTDSRGRFHSKRSMNESKYISHAVDFFFPLKYYLFGICYMKEKKEIYCIKPLSLIEKSLLSSLKQWVSKSNVTSWNATPSLIYINRFVKGLNRSNQETPHLQHLFFLSLKEECDYRTGGMQEQDTAWSYRCVPGSAGLRFPQCRDYLGEFPE